MLAMLADTAVDKGWRATATAASVRVGAPGTVVSTVTWRPRRAGLRRISLVNASAARASKKATRAVCAAESNRTDNTLPCLASAALRRASVMSASRPPSDTCAMIAAVPLGKCHV